MDFPGPTSYIPDQTKIKPKKMTGLKKPFGFNEGRFKTHDEGVPSPGTYDIKGTVNIKNEGK